jgi:hypothetical protein
MPPVETVETGGSFSLNLAPCAVSLSQMPPLERLESGGSFKSSLIRLGPRGAFGSLPNSIRVLWRSTSGVQNRLELNYPPMEIGGILVLHGPRRSRLELKHPPISIGGTWDGWAAAQ